MRYGVYRVSGRRRYRGHEPGTVFEAAIDSAVESRAINRGDIELLRHVEPDLEAGSWRLNGWPPSAKVVSMANNGATEAPDS
jgi:hypothetical protein